MPPVSPLSLLNTCKTAVHHSVHPTNACARNLHGPLPPTRRTKITSSVSSSSLVPGMLFTTPDLGSYISGAILYEETLFQNHADGTPFVDCLKKIGVIPGIKVDTGLSPLPGGHEVETWCSGLDGLVERAKKYYAQGARFAKWRAVLQITSDGAPSNLSIQVSRSVGSGRAGRQAGRRGFKDGSWRAIWRECETWD